MAFYDPENYDRILTEAVQQASEKKLVVSRGFRRYGRTHVHQASFELGRLKMSKGKLSQWF